MQTQCPDRTGITPSTSSYNDVGLSKPGGAVEETPAPSSGAIPPPLTLTLGPFLHHPAPQAHHRHLLLHQTDLSPLEKPVSRRRKRPEENQRSKTRHVLYILTFIDFRKSRSSKRKSSRDRKRDYSRDRSPARGNDRRERRHDDDRQDRQRNRDRDYRDEKGWENLQ